MIFAAGIGSRFKPWTDNHPKALALVNEKSLLQRNVEYLQANGIFDVVINVHHFSEQIIDAIQQQDFAIVRAMVFLGSILYIVGLILTDISYTWADPRVRFA